MNDLIKIYPILFPLYFASIWMLAVTVLGALSGWYGLMRKYPDRAETPLLQLKNQSGIMGGVGMKGVLRIAVCPSGLRLGIIKIFGIFSRDFLVPWQEIKVTRKDRLLWQTAVINFGESGTLRIPAYIADRLARSAQNCWPEEGPFPQETHWQAFVGVAKIWLLYTAFASLFFLIVPRIMTLVYTSYSAYPPISIAILFPAVFTAIVCLSEYFQRIKR